MAGPWEQYQAAPASTPPAGPWTEYAQAAPPPSMFDAAGPARENMFDAAFAPSDQGSPEAAAVVEAKAREAEDATRPPTERGMLGRANRAFQGGTAQGLTLGFFNELASAAMTPIELGIGVATGEDSGKGLGTRLYDAYQRAYSKGQIEEEGAYRANPAANIAGEVAGGLMTGGAAAKGGASFLNAAKPTASSMIPRAAAEGAAYGAISGAGHAEGGLEDRAKEAAKGAVYGGLAGGALGGVGAVGARVAALKSAAIPSADDLATASRVLYDQADQAGVVIHPLTSGRAFNLVKGEVTREGIHPGVHPKAFAALQAFKETVGTGKPVTLQEMERVRQIFVQVASSTESAERFMAGKMISKLDDFFDGLTVRDVSSRLPNPRQSIEVLKEARSLWRAKSKAEILEGLFYRAENNAPANYTQAGVETALRQQFRSIANNQAVMRRFSPDERKAILRVVRGAPLENTLRLLGKFAPTGVVSSAFSGGAGFAIGGPVGAVALPAAGFAARHAATKMTAANAERASAVVRNRGVSPQLALSARRRALLQGGISGGVPELVGTK